MTEELTVIWRWTDQLPATRALLLVETDQTTLRKVEFEQIEYKQGRFWVLSYWYGVDRRQIRVEEVKIKRWAYESDESVAELDAFAGDMREDLLRREIKLLKDRAAFALGSFSMTAPVSAAKVERAVADAKDYLRGRKDDVIKAEVQD